MIGGADENEPEDQPSTTTPPSTPPPPPPLPPPIASPSSPLQQTAGVGLGRRLFGSIRSLLPASPRAATSAPKLGLGLLLHLRPDHPSINPTPTLPASTSPSASEDDPLEEDAAAARPHAAVARGDGGLDAAAGLHSPAHTGGDVALEGDQEAGLVDGQQGAAPAAKEIRAGDESRPTDVASPSASEEDEARATGVSSASEDDEPEEGGSLNAAEWLRAAELNAGAGLHLPPVNVRCGFGEDGAATTTAPPNIMFRPAAEMGGKLALEEDQESGLALVDGHGHGQEGTIHTQAAAPAKGDDQFCASDESGASEEEDLVGEKEKVVEQQGAADRQGALVKDVDAAGDDQEKVLQQCAGDQLRAARDDQEVGEQDDIHPRDETTCDIAAAEDQEKEGSAENVDVVEGQEVVEQDGIHQRDATIYYIAVEEQEKVEGHSTEQCGSTGNNDDAVEDQEVLLPDVIDRKGQGTDGTAIDDQDKAMQQCDTYDLGTTENDDDDDAEAVGQGVCDEGGMYADNAVKNHEVAGLRVIDRMHATIDATGVEDQDKGANATYDLGTVENDDVMDDQEVAEQDTTHPMDDNAVEEEERLERHATHALGSTENVDDAVEDQEVVEQCVIDRTAENDDVMDDQEVVERDTTHSIDDIAVEEEEKLEQHATHRMGMGSTKNVDDVEDQEVVEQYVIGTVENDDAMDDQEVVEQCVIGTVENDDVMDDQEVLEQDTTHPMDDIDVEEEEKLERHATHGLGSTENVDQEVVEQCVIERTVENDDAMDDQEVVEQDTTHQMDDIAVEEKDKLEGHATHGLGSTENGDDAVDDQEVVHQCVIDRTFENDDVMDDQEVVEKETTHSMDDIAVEEEEKLERHATHRLGTTKNVDDVEDQEVVEQCVIGTVENDDVMDDEEVVEQDTTHPMDDIAVEEEEKLERHATHGLGSTENVDDGVDDQEVVEQCVIERTVENDDVMDDQEVVEQDTTHQMVDIAVEEKEKLEGHATHGLGSMENVDAAVEDQEVVDQCVIDRTFENDDVMDDQEAVEKDTTHSMDDIAVEEEKNLERHATHGLANGGHGGIWKKEKVKLPYPQRPGKLNCPFYMSKGTCSYGFSCNFHHPPLKANPDGSWCSSEQGNQGVKEILELNRIGLPIREGARNCTYYMRNGACRYGKHCHFNHPDHVIDAQFYTPTGWEDSPLQLEKSFDRHTTGDDTSHLKKSSDDAIVDDTSYSKKSSDHANLDDTSSSTGVLPPHILRMLLPPQKIPATTEAKVIPVKKDSNWSSTSDDSDGCCSADSSDGPLCKQENVDSSDWSLCKQEHVDYPERPGRPECPFYMRFGDCKFASRCKYHHTIDKRPTRYHPEVPSLGGEQTEYPERPGEPECPFYMKAQFCKFGAQCKFNHPKDSNPTLQGPTDAKKSVAANEHQPTRITLEDHMPQQQQHPERPGQPDCRYYLQFGECKFLSACIFNHPRDVPPSGPAHSDQIEPDMHDMPECPFYMKSGKCQFGSACKFRHPKDICSTTEGAFGHRTGSAYDNFTSPGNVVQQREQITYPERPGEPECFQYMRHGSCRFQMNCRYHHPADRLSRKQYDSTHH